MERLDGTLAALRIPHKRADQAQVVAAVGMREHGKTHLLRNYLATREPRRLVLDQIGDIEGSFYDFEEDWRDGLQLLKDEPRTCSVRFLLPSLKADTHTWGNEIFDALLSIDHRSFQWDLLMCMDEVHQFDFEAKHDPLCKLVRVGRHAGIRFAIGSQRMVNIPDDLRSEITDLAVFKINEENDRARLDRWTERGNGELAHDLEVGDCLLFSPL